MFKDELGRGEEGIGFSETPLGQRVHAFAKQMERELGTEVGPKVNLAVEAADEALGFITMVGKGA